MSIGINPARYQPLHDRVLLQVDPEIKVEAEKKSQGGIILSGAIQAPPSDVREALVLAVGGGEILFDGSIRELAVGVGDRVLVHVNEVLPIEPSLDPTDPVFGFISERSIISVVTKEGGQS